MFGLTDTDLQVHAIRHKEIIARGEARAQLAQAIDSGAKIQRTRETAPISRWARFASLIRSPIHSLSAGS